MVSGISKTVTLVDDQDRENHYSDIEPKGYSAARGNEVGKDDIIQNANNITTFQALKKLIISLLNLRLISRKTA